MRKAVIIGAGESGLAAANLLGDKGWEIWIVDAEKKKLSLPFLWIGPVTSPTPMLWEGNPLVIVSPGVPPDFWAYKEALNRNLEVISEIELAWRHLPPVDVIGITGTNGKSTVTDFVYRFLKAWNSRKSHLAGNIGKALSKLVGKVHWGDKIALELSSFQLERISTFRAKVGVLLNITPDHLDRYKDMDEYIEAKLNLFLNQNPNDFALFNIDDKICREIFENRRIPSQKFSYSVESEKADFFCDGEKILFRKLPLLEIKDFKLPGKHNLSNLTAAVAACFLCGIPPEKMKNSIKNLKLSAHRMELVGKINQVEFYDDSKATNFDAVEKAIDSFEKKIVLIMGGLEKGKNYEGIIKRTHKLRGVVFLGEKMKELEEALRKHVKTLRVNKMKEAVSEAFKLAKPGDVVLLSPGGASFDMFKDYKHRGKVFKKWVKEIARI